jgi:hypothetical protein
MLERRELILKVACGMVAALLLYRVVLAIVHINPLYHVTIPALPTLVSSTNDSSSKTAISNAVAKGPKVLTNGPAQLALAGKHTNSVPATNSVAGSSTNNQPVTPKVIASSIAPIHGSNILVSATNASPAITNSVVQGSNATPGITKSSANAAPPPELTGPRLLRGMPPGGFPGMPGRFPGMPPGGMPGMPAPTAPLPPEIQARIDKIIESEILAPVMRPMPTALMGIAGKDVFLRTSNGQTGLIKEGEELGGVKVLRVGLNRVLVEEQGERKELTIFSGLGSESLLSTQNDRPK